MFKYQCDKGSLTPIFEDSCNSVFDEAVARINSQSEPEGVLDVLVDVFKKAMPATPLYDRLVAWEFNNLPWQQYYEKLKEACVEEYTDNTPFSSLIHSGTLPALVRSYLEKWYVPATDSMKEQVA